jgi:hypothetical protein
MSTRSKSKKPLPEEALSEIQGLRRLIGQTHRRMKNGSLDFASGASILTRSYNSLTRLIATYHRIKPQVDYERAYFEEVRRNADQRRLAMPPTQYDESYQTYYQKQRERSQ